MVLFKTELTDIHILNPFENWMKMVHEKALSAIDLFVVIQKS